ncbi:hypothetical protein AAC387_Pa02g0129 [Persea americana]
MKTGNCNGREEGRKKETSSNIDSEFNQTIKSVEGFLRGGKFPDKVVQIQESEPLSEYDTSICSLGVASCHSYNDLGLSEPIHSSFERESASPSNTISNSNCHNLKLPVPRNGSTSRTLQRFISGARATDSARVARFRKELSVRTVILETLRELSWSGIPPYMRPDVWRLLLGYTTPNSDRRERVLKRKRLQYVDCVSQYYDIPDSERSEDEINMLRQIAVDCPRTVPDITFFQHVEVQKSLERVLYIWAIRHPASGYVQGINDLVTPFLIVFLSEHLQENMDKWSISDLSPSKFSNIEADCYWCLTKLLDGMQDHYTFSQPGIQRLVFKLKELVRRINEPISRHMEEEGLDFLQFSFRWFNCLLIREIPFHLVTRLWDTYLAEGDALPGFLVYIFASFLLTWSDMLGKLDFQEMVMFLQHLPTQNWTHQDLEMVLSRAYMWHTMFESSPNHLA